MRENKFHEILSDTVLVPASRAVSKLHFTIHKTMIINSHLSPKERKEMKNG